MRLKLDYPKIMVCTLLVSGLLACSPKPTVPEKYTVPPNYVQKTECKKREKTAVIAVIDTGLDMSRVPKDAKICKFGHKDFTNTGNPDSSRTIDPVPSDEHGHGTNITGVISKFAGDADYCMVILKYYSPLSKQDNLKMTIEAIKYATNIGAKYLNYSGGGTERSSSEAKAIQTYLDKGGIVIAAAGNERMNIDQYPYYPAMEDSRIISVGSVEPDGKPSAFSNFGTSIKRWEYGRNISGFGLNMSGTSQATAVAAGKIINEQECDK